MSNKNLLKVPGSACCLDMPDTGLFAFAETETDDALPTQVKITCYSGKVIPDHYWWGNLIIDLSGMSFPKASCPILWEHDTDRIVGMSDRPVVTAKGTLEIEAGTLLNTPDGENVAKLSKQKFPLQASIRATPTEIERIDEKQITTVNGQKMSGPLTVWRKSTYKETSVCVFGFDSNTQSKAFAENPENYITLEVNSMPNTVPFDITAFKAQSPEAYNAFTASITAPLATEVADKAAKLTALTAELEAAKASLAAATAQTESLTAENKNTIDRLSRLEKEAAIRHETDIRTAFSHIIRQELEKGAIPAALHTKFAACLSVEQFVEGDSRVLNAEKAREHVVKEVGEWKNAFAESPVLGGGGTLMNSPATHAADASAEDVNAFADSVVAHLVNPDNAPDILGF